ncbi:MAG: hypothetical protein AAGJ08_25640 [Cyanobacteria bacterium P01_H01_bin.35]
MAKLKRWESPRKQGRNIKGKGGAARLRQIKKQQKILRKKLDIQEKGNHASLFFCWLGWRLPEYSHFK